MKTLNNVTKFIFLFILFIVTNNLVSKEEPIPGEIHIYNLSNNDIAVTIYPVGCVFNGSREYKLKSQFQIEKYIVGGSKYPIAPNGIMFIEHDGDQNGVGDLDGLVGYGKYKIVFSEPNGEELVEMAYCFIDYGTYNYPWNGYHGLANDVQFEYHGNGNITHNNGYSLPSDRTIKIWDQRQWNGSEAYDPQNRSGFKTTSSGINFQWLNWPLKASDYGNTHIDPGSLYLELSILQGHTAKLLSGNEMTVEYGGCLEVDYGATLNFQSNCTLFVKAGGAFCNKGTVTGTPHIVYLKGLGASGCCIDDGPFVNSEIILEDSAIVQLPDSSVFTLDSSSKLIMGPHSELRMGTGAKILLRNGSSLYCDSAKFTSIDSNETWDGIYLSDLSYDTLKHCTIENALNGINVEDKYSLFSGAPATEVSN